jgi:hypothetical protein
VLNEAAYDHMRNQGLPAATIVSTITMIDGAFIAVSDGLPASASRLL